VPIVDNPWSATIQRWRQEGLPEDVAWEEFFGVDRVGHIHADNSPRYEQAVLEETDAYRVETTRWGQTIRNWKHAGGTPEFLHCTITDPDAWAEARRRIAPTPDRIDWDRLARNYPRWREQGRWIQAGLWFGFDVTHSWVVGTERLLMALIDRPDWCVDMWTTQLETHLKLLEMIWDAGYAFDAVTWCDDLGYKHNQFMSVGMYRELLKPVHRRACQWARARAVKVHLHSCGDVNPFVPEFLDIGVDALNPLEVKAGMDPIALKARFGDRLVLHGGINAVLWDDPDAIEAEMRKVIPVVKASGGYVFSSDHSVPTSVSLADFRRIVELARTLGSYE